MPRSRTRADGKSTGNATGTLWFKASVDFARRLREYLISKNKRGYPPQSVEGRGQGICIQVESLGVCRCRCWLALRWRWANRPRTLRKAQRQQPDWFRPARKLRGKTRALRCARRLPRKKTGR